jgi:hypothetical protein
MALQGLHGLRSCSGSILMASGVRAVCRADDAGRLSEVEQWSQEWECAASDSPHTWSH